MGLRWIACFCGGLTLVLSPTAWTADPMRTVQILREFCSTDLSAEWRVREGNCTGAEEIVFDDSSWPLRNLHNLIGVSSPFWLRKTVVIPEQIAGVPLDGGPAQLSIDCGGRLRVYVDGRPVRNLGPGMSTVPLTDRAYPGRKIAISIQVTQGAGSQSFRSVDLLLSELARLRKTTNNLLLDLDNALLLLRLTSGAEEARWRREFSKAVDFFDPEALYARDEPGLAISVKKTQRALSALQGLAKDMNVFVTGRAVLDPFGRCKKEELIEAAQSTTRQILDLLDHYPDLVVCRSEAMVHRWLEERDPDLHRLVVKRVNEHRYVFVGGSWSDFDPELIGGESIIRQYLLGERYFSEVFGQRVWIASFPEAPSAGPTLPEFLTGCGMMGVLFDPIAGRFPWNLFLWEAPSRARLLAYREPAFVPANPESSVLSSLETVYNRHKLRDVGVLFDINNRESAGKLIQRLRNANRRPLFPSLAFTDLESFIDRMTSNPYGVKYPLFSGRVTLARNADRLISAPEIKRLVRQAESRLEDLEKVYWVLSQVAGVAVPSADLDELWRRLLFYQRPAVLGGVAESSVLAEAREGLHLLCRQLYNRSKSVLLDLAHEVDTQNMPRAVVVFNPLSWVRDGAVSIPSPLGGAVTVKNHWGETVPSQVTEDGSEICFLAENVPPLGFKVFQLIPGDSSDAPPTALRVNGTTVSTSRYRFSIDPETGRINSLKTSGAEADMFLPGGGMWIEPDRFGNSPGTGAKATVQVTEEGPVRATIRIEKQWDSAVVIQEVQAVAEQPRVDIHTIVRSENQAESFRLSLTTAFFAPTFISAVAGGFEERKTVTGLKTNGPIPGYGWAALSAPGHTSGVALLQDGRSGLFYGSHEITMAFRPSETPMEFNASLYPYQGGWRGSQSSRQWEDLCHPFLVVQTDNHPGRFPPMYSMIQIIPDNVRLGSVRIANATGGALLRLWETSGLKSRAEITLSSPVLSAEELTLLEDSPLPLEYTGQTVFVPIGPFQIKTVRVLN